MVGAGRAAKRTQSPEECGGGQEGSQTHSERGVVEVARGKSGRSGGGGRRAAKDTQSREEWWRGHRRAAKRTQSRGGVVEGSPLT